jgi:hypothetical protein
LLELLVARTTKDHVRMGINQAWQHNAPARIHTSGGAIRRIDLTSGTNRSNQTISDGHSTTYNGAQQAHRLPGAGAATSHRQQLPGAFYDQINGL